MWKDDYDDRESAFNDARAVTAKGTLTMLATISLLCTLACDFYDGILAYPPDELIVQNEVVAVGRFVQSDTIADLGVWWYHQDSCNYVTVEYTFQTVEILKGPEDIKTLRLWNLDQYCGTSKEDVFGFVAGLHYLVYGNIVDSAQELTAVSWPTMAMYSPGVPFDDWNRADSIVACSLPQSKQLIHRLDSLRPDKSVLAGTDHNWSTLFLYSFGGLAYYDSKGSLRQPAPSTYLREVRKVARRHW